MSEEEQVTQQDPKEQKKQEEQDASKKALKTGAKAAANAYAGPVGGKAVDLASKTKLGDAVLNAGAKAINKNPLTGKLANAADKMGALDAADKAVDASSGGKTGGSGQAASSGLSKGGPGGGLSKLNSSNMLGGGTGSQDSGDDFGFASKLFSFMKNNPQISLPIIGGFFQLILLLVLVIFIVTSPAGAVVDFFTGIGDAIVGIFSGDKEAQEKEFYNTLKEVQDDMYDDGICIDINLIVAALTVNTSFDEMLEDGQVNVPDAEDNPDYDPDSEDSNNQNPTIDYNYKLMKKQIKLLANMQVINSKYELSDDDYCSESEEIIPVEEGDKNSSTKELIAQHDVNGFVAFFTKKSNEEKNYAYYIYKPAYEIDENGNKTCDESYAKDELKKRKKELKKFVSIGDYATREDSVFYWNLINSFIPDYYSEYLPDEGDPTRLEKIKEIADDIYLYYKDIGPSQTCAISFAGPSSLCPNGVTILGEKDVDVYDLEEYVAGVVAAEMWGDFPLESKKALAVAARTYVLKYTDYCTKTIPNNSTAQNFKPIYSDSDKQAATETAGEILIDKNGNIFKSEYDSWYCKEQNTCNYMYLPNGGSHEVTITNTYLGRAAGGHGRGMSQIAAADFAANKGMNYKEILSYFYSDGVSITTVSPVGGSGNEVAGGDAQTKLAYLFPNGLPGSPDEAGAYMITVSFPVVDINGIRSTKKATVHKNIAGDFVNIMTEIADSGFPIKDVGCYNWRNAAASTNRSHHSYGVACDLNSNENAMYKNGKLIAGSYYRPGDDPYSFPANGVVVKAFAKYGWGWGGSWNSSKDYMHFSFTNR